MRSTSSVVHSGIASTPAVTIAISSFSTPAIKSAVQGIIAERENGSLWPFFSVVSTFEGVMKGASDSSTMRNVDGAESAARERENSSVRGCGIDDGDGVTRPSARTTLAVLVFEAYEMTPVIPM